MTNRMKSRFLVTTAALLTGVSLASAQGLSGGGAASEKGHPLTNPEAECRRARPAPRAVKA